MRIFTAIEFDEAVRTKLADYLGSCRRLKIPGNYTHPENFHLTLHFLGEQEADRLDAVVQAMRASVNLAPFSLTCEGSGTFSQRDGKLLWAGIKPSQSAENLYRGLGKALKTQGFPVESRPFRPHITLIRRVPAEIREFPALEGFQIPVRGITLFESVRVEGRLTYLPLCFEGLTV